MTPDVRLALERVRELLLAKRWDPTACARDADGNRVEAVWPAASYSLCGAITHACAGDAKLDCRITIDVLGSDGLTKPKQLTHWENEPGRTVEEVIGLIDQACAAAAQWAAGAPKALAGQPAPEKPPALMLVPPPLALPPPAPTAEPPPELAPASAPALEPDPEPVQRGLF